MFSFGVLLWEVLQGDVPWAGVDPRTLTRRIAQGERLQVSSSWASSLQGLVLQCIHDDPDKRATAHVALDVLTSEMMQLEDSSAPPEQFLCPVSMEVMTDPVTTPCGTTYERSVIISCLSRQLVDPMTMQPCTPQQLIPNRCLKQLIEAWTEHSGRK
jgi:serine/threonine protein kinase